MLTTDKLVNELRNRCDNAKQRIWICTPFIGGLKDVQKIIGGQWLKPSIDLRVLTDIDDGFILKDTFVEFLNCGEVRSLSSLHAKIYIVDDWCLVTSANLTGTAFCRRYEVGQIIPSAEIQTYKDLFNDWWNKADVVKTPPSSSASKGMVAYQTGNGFTQKCKLPSYTALHSKNDKYTVKCDAYKDFAILYENCTGRNQDMVKLGYSIYQEIDYFFNYLYHDCNGKPSNKCIVPRHLTKAQTKSEIKKYFKTMKYDHRQEWRLERTSLVRRLLSPTNISSITSKDINDICMCLHCYWSYPINRTKFQNPANNKLADIRKYWKLLLHTGNITGQQVLAVNANLKNFGFSAIQELIAWYYPDEYPMINGNSNCGMRFFGYDIKD